MVRRELKLAGMKATEHGLFTPGTGAIPPALVGREQEQAVLSLCLSDLTQGCSPPHDVVLIGPRGNGKTVLLNWFQRTCRESRTKVDVAAIAGAYVPRPAALLAELVPPTRIARLLRRKAARWDVPPPPMHEFADRLIARCRKRPFAVLVDEAHTLDLEVGQLLLNASQDVRAEAPFLLALAGTPGLLAHFRGMNASFWDRLGSGLLGIGRLSESATKEALERPLSGQGVAIDVDALDLVVEQSQHYPYFTQIWGEALWDQHLATGETCLTVAHARAAQPAVEAQVGHYYERRYRELEAARLLPAASAVAALFDAGMDATATDHGIAAALATTGLDADGRLAAREELNRLGYIWCPPGQLPPLVWSAGIPSLMPYVRDRATAPV